MKNSIITLAIILLLTGLFPPIHASHAAEADIRYGGQYYPGEFLLDGYDFFTPVKLQVKHYIFSSGTENNEALISGNVDINVNSDSKSVALFNAIGKKALIIGTVQRGNRYSTIVRKEDPYKDWAELKGHTVGTRFGTGAEAVLRKYFNRRDDIDWSSFKWVNIKTEDMIAALANRQIDAFTVWAPTGEIAEAQGVGRLLRNYGDVSPVPVFIHTTRKFADKHPDRIIRFLMAHLKKAEMIKNTPEKAAKFAAKAAREKGIAIEAEAFETIFRRINFQITYDDAIIKELKETALFLKDQKKIKRIPQFYHDDSYIKKALKRLDS